MSPATVTQSGVRSISDLRGKRVIVGAPGSGTEVDARQVLKAYGLTYADLKVDYLGFAEAVQRLKDRQTDAAFVSAGFPTASIMELSAQTGVVILPITGKGRDVLLRSAPYYVQAVIPAGTYKGVGKIRTVSVGAQWLVDAKIDDDLVYGVTRALWHKNTRHLLESGHRNARLIRIKTALSGIAIPLHPGARRYYREAGLIK